MSDSFEVFTQLGDTRLVIEDHLQSRGLRFTPNFSGDFNGDLYFQNLSQNLKSKNFGVNILYTQSTSSTMNTFDSLPESINNLIVVAREQTRGRGNNNHTWISLVGCCMFTIYRKFDPRELDQSKFCLLEFAAAVACVKAIHAEPNHEQLPIKIKWPNDIYFDGTSKLGGILVEKSTTADEQILVKIGVGFNLDNEQPSDYLNRILREYQLPPWTRETFIARFLNHFDTCLNIISRDANEFIEEFKKNWLHQNQIVRMVEEFEIVGINEYGYLTCRNLEIFPPASFQLDFQNSIISRRH